MRQLTCGCLVFLTLSGLLAFTPGRAQQTGPQHFLIHMRTALAGDDAQASAVPNVAWAALKAGHKVTILVDATAVTSVTKGYGWLDRVFAAGTTALDRAVLSERARLSLSEQMKVPLDQVPRDCGEYFEHLRALGAHIFVNRTMMLLYDIDPLKLAPAVSPISLHEMVTLFERADRIIEY